MTRQSIYSGIGLRGRGQGLFDAQRADEHDQSGAFFQANPDAATLSPLAAYKARRPLAPNVPDVAGMQAFMGLLGTDVRMKGGFNPKAQDQLTGRTYDMNPKSLGYEVAPGLRGSPDEDYALATGQNPGGAGFFTPDELRQSGNVNEGLEDTGRRLGEQSMARQAMMGLKRFKPTNR